jgi:hypothetical protein
MWNLSVIDGPVPAYEFLGLDEEGQPMFGDPLPAYNLNIAAQIYTSELEPYRIEPALPKRVFAGATEDTVFLTFADEAEAIAALSAYWTEPN